MSYGDLSPELLVMISPPQDLIDEYRFFIGDGEVITGSTYKINGEHDEREGFTVEAYNLAMEVAKEKWQPSSVYSIDVCSLEPKHGEFVSYRVVEVNGFNSAGLYACDYEKLIRRVNEIADKEWIEYWTNVGVTTPPFLVSHFPL